MEDCLSRSIVGERRLRWDPEQPQCYQRAESPRGEPGVMSQEGREGGGGISGVKSCGISTDA